MRRFGQRCHSDRAARLRRTVCTSCRSTPWLDSATASCRKLRGQCRRGSWCGSRKAKLTRRRPIKALSVPISCTLGWVIFDNRGGGGQFHPWVIFQSMTGGDEHGATAGSSQGFQEGLPSVPEVWSGCGTDLRSKPSMCSKSAGLHVKSGRSLANATAAIMAS
jgi:hypothetical protein